MAANTTTYHVSTVYDLIDNASHKLAGIHQRATLASSSAMQLKKTMERRLVGGSAFGPTGHRQLSNYNLELGKSVTQMSRARESAGQLRSAVLGLGAAWAGGAAFSAGKHHLIDFNSTMQQQKVQMAGLLQLNTRHYSTFADSMARADRLVKQLQLDAQRSVGTTKDFVDMASRLARPISAAGLEMADLRNISHKATVAAKAILGDTEWAIDVAALDIEQALAGTLSKKERFARSLIEPLGYTTDSFNALKARERAMVVSAAFQQSALLDMAKAQETSFAGVTSTFQDHLEMALGKVGMPLMTEMTAEVRRWNHYIDNNASTVDSMVRSLSSSLVSGFGFVKDVATFFIEHGDTLLAMAKALVAYKVGQIAAPAISAGITGIGRGVPALLAGNNALGDVLGRRQKARGSSPIGPDLVPSATLFIQHGTVSLMSTAPFAHRMGRSLGEGLGRYGGVDAFFGGGLRSMSATTRTATSTLGALSSAVGAAVPWIGALSFAIQGIVSLVDSQKDKKREQERIELGRLVDRFGGSLSTLRNLDTRLGSLLEEQRQRNLGGTMTPLRRSEIEGGLLVTRDRIEKAQDTVDRYLPEMVKLAHNHGLFTSNLQLLPKHVLGPQIEELSYLLSRPEQISELRNAIDRIGKLSPGQIGDIIAGRGDKGESETSSVPQVRELPRSIVNVKIEKIEVTAKDPDRFIHDVVKAIDRRNRNPTQAKKAWRRGK